MNIRQRRFWETKEFDITPKGIHIKEKSPGKLFEALVSFDDIGNQLVVRKASKRGWLIAAFISLLFTIMSIVFWIDDNEIDLTTTVAWGVITVALSITYYVKSVDYLIIDGGMKNIFLYRTKPSLEGVDNFVKRALEERNLFHRKKYAKVDSALPIEHQIFVFQRLRDEEVITEEEYEKLKQQLVSGSNTNKNFVGFSS